MAGGRECLGPQSRRPERIEPTIASAIRRFRDEMQGRIAINAGNVVQLRVFSRASASRFGAVCRQDFSTSGASLPASIFGSRTST